MIKYTTALFLLLIAAMPARAAESAWLDVDGARLRYIIGGTGETVVLLHGFSGSAEGLYVQPGTFDRLVEAGYRVVALDQRGHGRSDKSYDPQSYGMTMVDDVRRLLDHLEASKAHLVGYSMGGKVANSFRAAHPGRLLSVTLGGYGWPWQGSKTSLEAAESHLRRDDVLPGNDIRALAAVRVGMYDLVPSEDSLKNNVIPALAVIGDRDTVVSAGALETLQSTMANLEVTVIPGTHAGPDGAPYKPVFAEKLVEFLGRH